MTVNCRGKKCWRHYCRTSIRGATPRGEEFIGTEPPWILEESFAAAIPQVDHSGYGGRESARPALSYYACSLKGTKVPVFAEKEGEEGATVTRREGGDREGRGRWEVAYYFLSPGFSFRRTRGWTDAFLPALSVIFLPHRANSLILGSSTVCVPRCLRGRDERDFGERRSYLFSLQLSRVLIFSTTSALSPSFPHFLTLVVVLSSQRLVACNKHRRSIHRTRDDDRSTSFLPPRRGASLLTF